MAALSSQTSLAQFHRKLMKQLHPDKNGHPRSKEAFLKVQEAYAIVKAGNEPAAMTRPSTAF